MLLNFFFFHGDAVRVLGCAVSSAILAEILAKKIFGKPPVLQDGSSILLGILFGLMCPPSLASGMVAAGSFFGVFVGKEIFGGTGEHGFHPALVGQIFLQAVFSGSPGMLAVFAYPEESLWAGVFGRRHWDFSRLFENNSGLLAEVALPAILLGGLLLIGQRILYWEIPFLYLGALWILSIVFHLDTGLLVFSGSSLLVAFFILADTATTPMTRVGVRVFAFGSACMVVLLRAGGRDAYEFPFAILMMNALTPWIDVCLKPRSLKTAAS